MKQRGKNKSWMLLWGACRKHWRKGLEKHQSCENPTLMVQYTCIHCTAWIWFIVFYFNPIKIWDWGSFKICHTRQSYKISLLYNDYQIQQVARLPNNAMWVSSGCIWVMTYHKRKGATADKTLNQFKDLKGVHICMLHAARAAQCVWLLNVFSLVSPFILGSSPHQSLFISFSFLFLCPEISVSKQTNSTPCYTNHTLQGCGLSSSDG